NNDRHRLEPSRPAPQRYLTRSGLLVGIVTVAVLSLLAFTALRFLSPQGMRGLWSLRTAPQIHSIAVLPLANLSADKSQEYFADGITEALTTDLAKISALRVISRTSATHFRNSSAPVQQIAAELKVDAIVEGSVVRAGNRVRITAQLIDARGDRHLWAETYDRDLSDILDTQNTVVIEIAQHVQATLTPSERDSLAGHATVLPSAYDAYLHGRGELSKQRQEALHKGLEYFEQAIALDRLYA